MTRRVRDIDGDVDVEPELPKAEITDVGVSLGWLSVFFK